MWTIILGAIAILMIWTAIEQGQIRAANKHWERTHYYDYNTKQYIKHRPSQPKVPKWLVGVLVVFYCGVLLALVAG